MGNDMGLNELEKVMLEYGLVIRAIPYESVSTFEKRHKDKYPEGVIYYDETAKREMLRVVEKNSQGGKFVIATNSGQGSLINNWGKPVIFYDSIAEAISSLKK